MDIAKVIKYLTENYDMLLQALVVVLGAIGLVAETIARILPGNDSALTKVAKVLAKAGEYVTKILSWLRIPNNKPKE